MIWHLIIAHLLGMASPGPDFFYILRTGARYGRAHALFAVAGIVTGVMFWAGATMLGLSWLLHTIPPLQTLLMLAGGAYLLHLGRKLLLADAPAALQHHHLQAETAPHPPQAEFKKGLLVNLSNPKIVIYFSSVMAAVLADIDPSRALWILALLLVETILFFGALACLFSGSAVKRFYQHHGRRLDQASGVFFLGFGSYLLYQGIRLLL